MYLETWKQLESGRKFYEKNGFENFETTLKMSLED